MANQFQQVQTYQLSALAALSNQNAFIGTTNKKFKDFQHLVGNLGDTVTFDLPPRFVANDTLTASFQDVEQRVQPLTVDKAKNVAVSFTNQQFLFNAEEYMDRFGKSMVSELGAVIEADVARNCLAPYRFYKASNTIDPINSFGQLATALANMRAYGAANHDFQGYLDNVQASAIVNSGLNQFVLDRNEKMGHSWELGEFSNCRWNTSNFLPVHIAGSAGQNADTLTFSSISGDGSQITFTGASSDVDTIKENDLIEFQTDIRYLTFVGHQPSSQRVQVRATADANATGGTVVVDITPALISTTGKNQNLSRALAGTDTALVMPSHRRGMINSGKSLYLAMPMLPDQHPFPTAHKNDPETGCSLRMYFGSTFGANQQGFVNDVIWGSTQPEEYGLALLFPL